MPPSKNQKCRLHYHGLFCSPTVFTLVILSLISFKLYKVVKPKTVILWVTKPHNLVGCYQLFDGFLHMEAEGSSKILASTYQTTRVMTQILLSFHHLNLIKNGCGLLFMSHNTFQ